MLSEWNIIPTIIVILLVILVPLISSNSVDEIFDFIDVNDNDVFSEFQQPNITNIFPPFPSSSTAANIKSKIQRNSTALLLQPFANGNVVLQTIKKLAARNSKRNVIDANRTISKTCKQVMGICKNGPKSMIPVCDNMNQTHRSPCSLALFNCKRMSLHDSHSRILVHVGPCNINSPVFTFEEEVCPVKCSQKYRPVCDTKQKTYRNFCTFQKYNCLERKNDEANASFLYALTACNQSSITISVDEQSERPIIDKQIACAKLGSCNGTRQAVCDSNGHWHRNQCAFLRAQCIAMQSGQRLSLADEKWCSTNSEKKEVKKGQNSKSHSQRASRRCYRQCAENLAYQPICATTFVTYPNRCLFLNAKCRDKNLGQLYYGECRDCMASNCNETVGETESDSNFVCDQAGRTKKKCEFEMLRCIYERKFGYNITAAYMGRCCPTEDTCEQPFDEKGQLKLQKAVCDSRNITHSSRCHFEVHKCREEKITHRSITLLNEDGGCSATFIPNDKKLLEDVNETMKCNDGIECDTNYEPICGTDGITYVNRCRLIRARCLNKTLLMAYNGECCTNRCEQHWAPVCDNQNITHLNLCMFSIQNCTAVRRDGQSLSIVRYTACPDDACRMQCKRNDYQPVCASNGITYQNECELNGAICGLNKERNRWDSMRSEEAKLELDYRGECCEEMTRKCNDSDNLSPVCDSEGYTHNNICEYERMACLSRKRFRTNLTIRYWGECCVDNCQHEQSGMTLCDDTQTTHHSWCKFRLAQCESHRRNNRTLQMAYMGECCAVSSADNCTDSGPICDTDGTTHPNLCIFRHRQCIMNRTQQKLIKIAYYGVM
ncbi:Kazal-type serine protease inhibitor domain family protein [Acanthocheilonema viteae]